MRPTLAQPGSLIGLRECVQVLRCRGRVVDPLAQGRTAVDDIDGAFAVFVFVVEISPQWIMRIEAPDRLEGERLDAPGLERAVIVAGTLGVNLYAVAELARVFVKGRLEPAFAQGAAIEPLRASSATAYR